MLTAEGSTVSPALLKVLDGTVHLQVHSLGLKETP